MTRTGPEGVDLPTYDDVEAAARRVKGAAVRTPLLRSAVLDRATGARVWVKAEPLQVTGSFKFRGAYNRLARLPEAERKRGVVAFSSGNHAQGVAEAARRFGAPCRIVMPADAPPMKLARTRAAGAWVTLYDRATQDREAIAARLAAADDAALTPAFDHFDIIAGQGTAGLEAVQDVHKAGERFDAVLCCVGGGGLLAGIALACEGLEPDARLFAVEPAGFDDQRRSFLKGERVSNSALSGSICDALLPPTPGVLTFAINHRRGAEGLVVTDAEAVAAMRFAYTHLKLVLEPGGAVALAAALTGKTDLRGARVLVIASGGNVDPAAFAGYLAQAA